ncbi:hypothetical protein MRB53_034448 [Persea americana]|uniref:Uncharacterized protein n=1 Tax=Persea americana TaxID=3435 RepID=A0ACC2K1R8_PERAE|nr:hypothetical protein MRB53_034448 [Persea americana]
MTHVEPTEKRTNEPATPIHNPTTGSQPSRSIGGRGKSLRLGVKLEEEEVRNIIGETNMEVDEVPDNQRDPTPQANCEWRSTMIAALQKPTSLWDLGLRAELNPER